LKELLIYLYISFILSFFLCYSDLFLLLIVGAEGYRYV